MRFPEFSGEWEKIPFEENLERLENGANYNVNDKDGVPMSRIETISTGQIDYSKVGYCANPTKVKHYIMQSGDILFSHINSLKHIGKTAYYNAEQPLYHGMNLLLLRCKENVNSKFLYYLINNPNFLKKCQILAKQAVNQASISTSDLKQIIVHKPNQDEQAKIDKFLSLIDQRISTQIKVIEKLESLMKGLCNQLTNCVDGASVALSCILQERNEKSTKNNQYEVLSSTVKGIFTQREYFSKDIASANNVGYKIVRLNDIVLSPQNLWMGNINYNDCFDIGIVSPSYKVYKINSSFDMTYIAYLLKSHRALYNYMMVSEQGASIVRRNLNIELFEQLIFKLPSLERQRKVGGLLSYIKKQLKLANEQLSMYEKQKQYLLQKMFI